MECCALCSIRSCDRDLSAPFNQRKPITPVSIEEYGSAVVIKREEIEPQKLI